MKKHKKITKLQKILIIVIPFIVILGLLYSNFFSNQYFNYYYEIKDNNYLSPTHRISNENEYTELISSLVYFNVEIPRNSNLITIQSKLKPSLIENERILLGAKNKEEWSYDWNLIYNPNIDLTDCQDKIKSMEEIENLKDVTIATDENIILISNKPNNYEEKETKINTTLRGSHEFYFYTETPIDIKIKKQDINWYNGSDNLSISILDINNNLITSKIIEDDGVTYIKNKEQAVIQEVNINHDLKPGVYILKFSSFDGLIKEININTNKIVSKRLFLADNQIYQGQKNIPQNIYTENNQRIKILTYHNNGLQNISFNNDELTINKTHNTYFLDINKPTSLEIPKNDIIISSTNYIAFNNENYFQPFKQNIIPLNDYEIADYIVTNYKQPVYEDDWIITETSYNINELYIKDNKLSLVYNIPHLNNNETKNNTISIDYINITIFKPTIINLNNLY